MLRVKRVLIFLSQSQNVEHFEGKTAEELFVLLVIYIALEWARTSTSSLSPLLVDLMSVLVHLIAI